jgi:hypothetical protein
VKTDASAIDRWIRLANLLPPDAKLLPPEVVQEGWNPPVRSKKLKRLEPHQHEGDPRSTALLMPLWRAWQKQFGKRAPEHPLDLDTFPKRVSRARAKTIVREAGARLRLASMPMEVSFVMKGGRGRPRKGERVGLVTRLEDWTPLNVMELYPLFYAVRTSLEKIARSVANPKYGDPPIDIPVSAAIFISPSGEPSLFRGASGQFLEDLLRAGLSRIRICPICSRIYYARRIDKGACSPRCCDTFNARKFRNPDIRRGYEKTRKENRRRKVDREQLAFTRSKGDSQ